MLCFRVVIIISSSSSSNSSSTIYIYSGSYYILFNKLLCEKQKLYNITTDSLFNIYRYNSKFFNMRKHETWWSS